MAVSLQGPHSACAATAGILAHDFRRRLTGEPVRSRPGERVRRPQAWLARPAHWPPGWGCA
jgi:hypothetical protein